ncbi:hypothetical protein MUU72_04245 [Streptomyces sp. RS10V-4]|uniref:hypothetical protein n=1 Tax=Streptomyces rhizoryzae TaxID=2932493 RepID=UPI00200468D8|nr:hypothetical protein [Streptomyces rhizoryzae]MCK7622339.1 hypothetical protein [Streptomyces rhizoryzae]
MGGCTFCYGESDLEALAGPVREVPEDLTRRPRGSRSLGGLAATAGTLAPWLAIWAETRTEAADRHLCDAVDDWLIEHELAVLHFGFCDEVHAAPELLPWLLALDQGRLTADQLTKIEYLAHG